MIGEIRGYGWTHDSGPLDAGPENSSYKTLVTMKDKLDSQLSLGKVLRSVAADRVAKQVIESHFLPDMRGNLMAYTRQKIRCVKWESPTGGCLWQENASRISQHLGDSRRRVGFRLRRERSTDRL